MSKKIKPNKNFRKESRKQENKMMALLALGAVILAVIIVLSTKIDFSKCSNAGMQDETEETSEESGETVKDTVEGTTDD